MGTFFKPTRQCGPQRTNLTFALSPIIPRTNETKFRIINHAVKKLESTTMSNFNNKSDDLKEITSDSSSDDESFDHRFAETVKPTIQSTEGIRTRSNTKIQNRKPDEIFIPESRARIRTRSNVNTKSIEEVHKRLSTLASSQKIENVNASSKKKNNTNYMLYIVAVILFASFLFFYISNSTVFANDNYTEYTKESVLDDVRVTLKSMKSRYKNQKLELWHEAYVAIGNIIRHPASPSIILLLGNRSDPLDCLAVLLGNVSSNALNSGSLLLTPDKFDSDVGAVIESFKLNVQNRKAVIIWDLLNINTEALRAFHNLCDKINPLVEEVIFIITIIADGYDKERYRNPIEFVEEALLKKLSGKMKKDAIQPLITRITDGAVLTVEPEPNIEDCPLPRASKRI